MAIQIAGTTVIDNSRNISNIGTISGATITVGAGKTLDVSAGTLTLATNQVPGTAVVQGTTTTRGTLELATTAEGNAGTDTARVPSVAVAKAMIDTLAPETLGDSAQSWTDIARSPNVSYQNTTGDPIMLYFKLTNASAIQYAQVSVNNSTWITVGNSTNSNSPNHFIVPNNWYYKATQTVGTTSIDESLLS